MLRAVLIGTLLLVIAVAIVSSDALAAACPSPPASGSTVVPDVARMPLDAAVDRLLARHLRISIPHFIPFRRAMAEQGRGRLANYHVRAQSPSAGTTVGDGRTVVLVLSDPNRVGEPLGSIVVPTHHPGFVSVPNLIGKRYSAATAAGESFTTGIWVRVGTTRSLTASASTCGLDAFVVSTQTPPAGTLVPWEGVVAGSVRPPLATVTVGLVS